MATAKSKTEQTQQDETWQDETQQEQPAADPQEELVDLFVDRDPSDQDPNKVIGINGKLYVMPKGEISRVPKFVKDEYDRAKRAQYKADKTVSEMKGIKAAN